MGWKWQKRTVRQTRILESAQESRNQFLMCFSGFLVRLSQTGNIIFLPCGSPWPEIIVPVGFD